MSGQATPLEVIIELFSGARARVHDAENSDKSLPFIERN